MASNEVQVLRDIAWLAPLCDAELEELARGAVQRRHARGEQVFAPAARPESVYLLVSGLVRIFRISESGAETSLGYVAPGELFGELAAFGDFPRESFAVAVAPSVVCKLPREAVQRVLAAHAELALVVTQQVGVRLKRVENRLEDLVFRSVRSRVARMLVELAESFGHAEGDRRVIDIAITQGELATLVGATRQTVNQTLRELHEEGLVGREDHKIVLWKPDQLERVFGVAAG